MTTPMIERERPLVVAIVEGGLVQDEYKCAGVGVPEFHVLDFDREGEEEDSRNEWCDYAQEVADELFARGEKVNDLFDQINHSRPEA